MNKKLIVALACFSMLLPSIVLFKPTETKAANANFWGDQYSVTTDIGLTAFTAIGLGNRDPRAIAASVIQVIMGFLGVVAVILILVGGFKWMTSQGNDAKVQAAQKLMTAGVAGLLIILAAFGVSVFVLNALGGVTGAEVTSIPQNQ